MDIYPIMRWGLCDTQKMLGQAVPEAVASTLAILRIEALTSFPRNESWTAVGISEVMRGQGRSLISWSMYFAC